MVCWNQGLLLRDQCLLPWWSKCQSPVSPRGRNPSWRVSDGMRHAGIVQGIQKRRSSDLVLRYLGAVVVSAFSSAFCLCSKPFLPHFTLASSWHFWAQLLSLWVIVPASFQSLLSVTFCAKKRIPDPLSLPYPGFFTPVRWNWETPLLSPVCSQRWMEAGECLSPIPGWEAHQGSWARDEGNIYSPSSCPGETSGTILWVLGAHNYPCSLRDHKNLIVHPGIPNFCSIYCTSH